MKRLALILLMAGAIRPSVAAPPDYPTAALADYVFACMAANGQSRAALDQCSCSIDVIASIVPYEDYVEAETVLSMIQVPGEKTAVFRDVPWTKEVVKELRQAQAEAEIRCF
jgi:hypothetical protein